MLTKSINATLFTVDFGPLDKQDILLRAPTNLKVHCFMSIDDIPEPFSCGWVSWEDIADTTWSVAPPEKGQYMAFALRIDTRRIPPALLDKEVSVALKAEETLLQEQGRKFVSRERKQELKEQVKLRLMRHTMPTPKQIGIIWDTLNNTVFALTTNDKELGYIKDLFYRSFHVELLEPEMNFDTAPPSEFLAWFWFNSEVKSGFIDDGVIITTTEKMVLSSLGAGQVSTDGAAEEAKLALRLGKTLTSLGVSMDDSNVVGKAQLSGRINQMNSVKLAPYDRQRDEEEDAFFLDRVFCLERMFAMLNGAYLRFQVVRESVELEQGVWIYGTAGAIPPKQLPLMGGHNVDAPQQ